jgi:nickel/cobalt transporter (NicO) family protein
MRTVRLLLSGVALALVLGAHPMGNFSVNHYARIQLEPDGAEILFVLDLAEIPTFELLQKWGLTAGSPKSELQAKAVAEAREWVKQLRVTSDGKPVAARFLGAEMVTSDGAGNLPVMRIKTRLKVNAAPGRLEYADGTYPDRTAGWKEVVVMAKGGAGIKSSTAGSKDVSQGLTAYPQDATVAPPQDLKAVVVWVAAPVAEPVVSETREVQPAPAAPVIAAPVKTAGPVKTAPTVAEPNSMGQVKRNDFLSRALKGGEIGWGLGLLCIAVAFWFGALHALEPGHGKTMVAAYLVGAKGTVKHAIFLGGMVTFTHTISVFFLGLITLFLSQYIMPDKISKVLGVISGLTIVYLGGMLLYRRSRGLHGHDHGHDHHHHHDEFEDDSDMAFSSDEHSHHHHDHDHSHGAFTHTHDGHTHSHVPEGDVTFKSLIALGASGGMVPCPSALVLLLSAISIGRTGFGLLLLLSFSLGLALVLMAMGLLVVYAKNLFPQRELEKPNAFFTYMPVISAALIFVIGIVLTGNSLGVIPVMRFFG